MRWTGEVKGLETKVLKIEGMTCNHCKSAVNEALSGLAGVRSVDIDLDEATATLLVDPQSISWKAVKEMVEAAGYKVVNL